MNPSLISRRDIDFMLHDWLAIDGIERNLMDDLLDLSERLASEHFLTHYKQADEREPQLTLEGVHVHPAIGDALKAYSAAGLFAAGFPEDLGGLGLPYVACAASFAYFAAANIATAAYPMLTVANARLISTFGTAAQVEHFARREISGEWFGTMCLSEPQAGSSLADVRTRAVRMGSDEFGERYAVTGNKMWISGGDQDVSENIVHLVLAKVPTADGVLPEGTEGLSLFIVPKLLPDQSRNDVAVAGLNHKMGYRGTANTLLNFGEGGGATGWLVGEAGQGLRQMFLMMNEARIGVGIGAAALGYRSHRLSVNYARERLQGRGLGKRDGKPIAIIEHPDVKRMLFQQKAYVEGALALCLLCAELVDDGGASSQALLGLLTPVAKSWPSEFGLVANDLAIQIHGGYGYSRDFDVEQLWRDNRLNPIHEGTAGIQAIDLLGRKILRDEVALPVLGQRIEATVATGMDDGDLRLHARKLEQAWTRVLRTIDRLGTRKDGGRFDNATLFLTAFGHVVVAWIWLDQAIVASRLTPTGLDEERFIEGKRRACAFFFEHELPKVAALLGVVDAASGVASSAPADVF